MRRLLRHICWVLLWLAPAMGSAATLEDMLAEYPLKPGSRWVHRHVRYDGVGGVEQDVVTKTWLTETTFVEQRDIEQGILFVLATRGLDGDIATSGTVPPADFERAREELASSLQSDFRYYLWREEYLYEVPAWAVATDTRAISPAWLRRQEAFDTPLPYPLSNVTKFQREQRDRIGDTYNGFYTWAFAGQREDLTLPYGEITDAALLAYPTTSGRPELWIKEGIGPVRERYQHGGSYFGSSSELVEFKAGD